MKYQVLLRPRWVVLHVIVVVVVPLFALAGFWQIDRLHERREKNTLIRSRESMPVRSLDDVLADGDASHRRVRVVGRYDTSEEVVLVGRPGNNGVDGSHVLTPLVVDKDDAVLVDRGWVPPGLEDPPLRDAAPSAREVVVTGVLLPTEGHVPLSTGGGQSKLANRIDVERIGEASKHRFVTNDLYLLLQAQRPPQVELPKPVHPIGLSEGPHLGYAVQWFLFIPTLLAVYFLLLRREVQKPDSRVTA